MGARVGRAVDDREDADVPVRAAGHGRRLPMIRPRLVPRPPIAVVVPFRGTEAEARRLLAALGRLELGPGDELLVVDNGGGGAFDGLTAAASGHRDRRALVLLRAQRRRGANGGALDPVHGRRLRAGPAILDAYFDPEPAARCGIVAGAVRAAPGESLAARYAASRGHLDETFHLEAGPIRRVSPPTSLSAAAPGRASAAFRRGCGRAPTSSSAGARRRRAGPSSIARAPGRASPPRLACRAAAKGGAVRRRAALGQPALPGLDAEATGGPRGRPRARRWARMAARRPADPRRLQADRRRLRRGRRVGVRRRRQPRRAAAAAAARPARPRSSARTLFPRARRPSSTTRRSPCASSGGRCGWRPPRGRRGSSARWRVSCRSTTSRTTGPGRRSATSRGSSRATRFAPRGTSLRAAAGEPRRRSCPCGRSPLRPGASPAGAPDTSRQFRRRRGAHRDAHPPAARLDLQRHRPWLRRLPEAAEPGREAPAGGVRRWPVRVHG